MKRAIHIPFLISSILLSIMLWVVVSAQNSLVKPLSLDIQLQSLDQEKFFVRNADRVLPVLARGSVREMDLLQMETMFAAVDLQRAKPGKGFYPIRIYPDRLRALLVDLPQRVPVEIEAISEKEIAVTVEVKSKLADGNTVLDEAVSEPAFITVRGPKSEIDRITKAKAVLDLNNVSSSRTGPYEEDVFAYTSDDSRLENVQVIPFKVNITALLMAAPVEKTGFVQVRFSGQPAPGFQVVGYDVEPPQVNQLGGSRAIAKANQIFTSPVSLEGLSSDTTVEVPLAAPPGIRLNPKVVRVRVRIVPASLPTDPSRNGANPAPPTNSGGNLPGTEPATTGGNRPIISPPPKVGG